MRANDDRLILHIDKREIKGTTSRRDLLFYKQERQSPVQLLMFVNFKQRQTQATISCHSNYCSPCKEEKKI